MAFIYVVENQIDGKVYVGQTHFPDRRQAQHFSRAHGCPVLYASIEKYGQGNFEFVLLENCCSQKETDERESYWIQCLNSIVPGGYNCREGGLGGTHTEETKKRISASHKGKKHSTAHKKANSLARQGSKHHMYGKAQSQETKQKISRALEGRKFSEEHKNKISLAMCGENNHQYGKPGCWTGRKHSLESKQKMRKAALRRWGK